VISIDQLHTETRYVMHPAFCWVSWVSLYGEPVVVEVKTVTMTGRVRGDSPAGVIDLSLGDFLLLASPAPEPEKHTQDAGEAR
jgi:hypothetical protein